ncbi:MAG: endonuclease/exonuclease/phosphatase family protein [Anaerolineae bacterium]|nr:endonuclease/exonuclease/phosphatase family protein [Anaerolineae bacterium]
MRNSRLFRAVEATAVLLFLVQAVRVLFSVLFGLIYDAIFSETLALSTLGLIMLFVIAAFLTPLAAPRRSRRVPLLVTALVAALARIPLTINLPAIRLWSSILIVGAAGVYAVTLLRERPRVFPTSLLLAFAADQSLRAAGDTFDVGLRDWWLPVQALLSLATCVVAWLAFSRSQDESPAEEGIGIAGGLAVGALLFLETSLLGFPNGLARWSGVNYTVIAPLLMAITLLPLMPGVRRTMAPLLGGLGLFFLALAGLVAGKQAGGAIAALGLLLAQFLVLIPLLDVVGPRRSGRTGLALALGMVLFLVLNFALAFTFTYPYTILAFRGMGLHVFLIAAAVACLPALRLSTSQPVSSNQHPATWTWLSAALVVLLATVFAWPPTLNLKETGPIRVGTYNIHYGYNTSWQLNLEAQARTIEESGADIVVLQEVDACRITSYGVDDALWLARRLGMQEVYGPALEGLSGIALLTRFPIAEADTRLLTSQLEQTSIVHARMTVGDRPLDGYGVWMGLEPEERARQLDDALAYIGAASPAVFGGDFNSTPDSPIYALIQAAGFDDPFIVGGFDPAPTSPAIEPDERIDFVWARGLDVRDGQVLDSLASDHRMVVVELALP